MPIDRRIANGLAWAGAFVVIAIPAADAALRQFAPPAAPQVAVVDIEETVAPSLPTPAAQRPKPVIVADTPAVEPAVTPAKPTPPPAPAPTPDPDPVQTATATPRVPGADAVDSFLQSGRSLPSYITGGGTAAPVEPAPSVAKPVQPAETVITPEPQVVAALPRTRIVTFPTPVSERPASRPQVQAVARPPLVIDTQGPVITAVDLEDWESGPLSEFLASRQDESQPVSPDYDGDGFFLDEGPNRSNRSQRFPRAYEDRYYSFE